MNKPPLIFTHLPEYDGEALKSKGGGFIKHSIYKDNLGRLYIFLDDNLINKPNKGRLTHKLFPLSVAVKLTPKNRLNSIGAYDKFTGEFFEDRNRNMSAFLRAVTAHLNNEFPELFVWPIVDSILISVD